MTEDARPTRPRPAEPEGGDPVCWLDRVCPDCGRLAEDPAAVRCARCGQSLPG
ncbi:hypothetical protein [Modestobacter sp. SYSU DS0290]